MTTPERPSSVTRSTLRRPPLLVREPGQRCDFCGALTNTAAVAAGRQGTETVICPDCVEQAARQILRPSGGDAA